MEPERRRQIGELAVLFAVNIAVILLAQMR